MTRASRHTRFHLVGWVFFLICSLLFLYTAVRDGDTILALASLVFLGGCIAFLIPLLFPGPEAGSGETDSIGKSR